VCLDTLAADMPTRSRTARTETIATCVITIRAIIRVLRLAAQDVQHATGITAAQVFVLQQLGGSTPLSLNELAERTLTDRTSVAEVVQRLQERRLVRRVPAPTDRRRAAISVTPEGRTVLKRVPVTGAPLLLALETLERSELTQLARGLTSLSKALRADSRRAPFVFNDEPSPRRSKKPRASR
jgi:DNA-binding MarR family transcriptional regulator